MQQKQQTIQSALCFSGKGLHSGKVANMTVNPAPENYGIKFVRTDIGEDAIIEAVVENVSSTTRCTTLSKGEATVMTVEHLLAALTGMGIDNARIDIDNIEVPIIDGSAEPYAQAILKAGVTSQNADRVYLTISEPIEYRDDEKGIIIRIESSDSPAIDSKIDFNSRVIGVQTAHWDPSIDFATEIACCRTFCFFHELEYLHQNNLIKGGDVDNALVIVEHPVEEQQLERISEIFGADRLEVRPNGYLSNVKLHYPNECARHKMLDIIGDFRLLGGFLKARVTTLKSGHRTNVEAVKLIRKQILK